MSRPDPTPTPTVLLSWPGYGTLFFWQLGVQQFLQHTYDLTACHAVGSSAGALLAVLGACDVPPQAALGLAHELCLKHRVYERPLGLMGVWGRVVKEWLDQLLPADAVDRCSGRVRIVITALPFLQREVVASFKDRADLIDCCLASCHVPYVMDWRLTALCRGRRCVDGSLLWILTRRCAGLKPPTSLSSSLLLFDPWKDRQLRGAWSVLRCVLLCGKEGAQRLLDQGYAHASALARSGALGPLDAFKKNTSPVPASEPGSSAGCAAEACGASGPAAVHTISGISKSSSCGSVADAVAVIAAAVPAGK